eukprot:COSAG04_NODE_3026_length_3264_cov_16.178515_2_plen_199_part_00
MGTRVETVHRFVEVMGTVLRSKVNGMSYQIGVFRLSWLFLSGMAYVLLSRARSLRQLALVGRLDPSRCKVSMVLRALTLVLAQRVPVPWVEGYVDRGQWAHVRGRAEQLPPLPLVGRIEATGSRTGGPDPGQVACAKGFIGPTPIRTTPKSKGVWRVVHLSNARVAHLCSKLLGPLPLGAGRAMAAGRALNRLVRQRV